MSKGKHGGNVLVGQEKKAFQRHLQLATNLTLTLALTLTSQKLSCSMKLLNGDESLVPDSFYRRYLWRRFQ